MVKGAQETSSYEEELEAMKQVIDWINAHAGEGVTILIVTDSQSLCRSLCDQSEGLEEIHLLLDECTHHLNIQWVPGHAGIEGNELADHHAKQAANLTEDPRSINLGSAKPVSNRSIKEKLPIREDVVCAYSCLSRTLEARVH